MADNFTAINISQIEKKFRHRMQSSIVFVAMSMVTIGLLSLVLYTLAVQYHAI